MSGDVSGEQDTPDPGELARLETALRSLRRLDRLVFLAHRQQGLSYAAIAMATGLSEAQVKRCMARALYDLRRVLSGQRLPWWYRWLP